MAFPIVGSAAFRFEAPLTLAKKAGLPTVDLSNWTDGRAAAEILVSVRDHHPNSVGHELIAACVKAILLRESLGIAGLKTQAP